MPDNSSLSMPVVQIHSEREESNRPYSVPDHHEALILLAEHFDATFYCNCYPDIDPSLVNPLEHYFVFGWKENRDPSEWFSTKHYLSRYRDVEASGLNPLLHYILFGRAENRRIWRAGYTGRFDMDTDRQASFVSETALRDLIEFPLRELCPPPGQVNLKCLDIHWLIPEFSIGSGGHMTIFRMVRWLELFGHKCTIWLHNSDRDAEKAAEEIIKHFQVVQAKVLHVDDGFAETTGDIAVATGWQTTARVMNAQNFRERFYFVQDYEPSFHPMGSHALAALWSYNQNIACICASPWLAATMEKNGRWSRHFWLAYDKESYFSPDRRSTSPSRQPRIALYARRGTARRAVELAILALEHLARSGIDFHVDMFGEELSETRAPFSCTSHGILAAEGLAALYHQADLGICFSSTNYSLVPQEMMACALPVVEIDVESTRCIFPSDVVAFTEPHPLKIAAAVEMLLEDPSQRMAQAKAALEWVSQYDWEKSARMVEQAFTERLAELELTQRARSNVPKRLEKKLTNRIVHVPPATIKASVCIPAYNGGGLLVRVIEAVQRQRAPWQFEIVVVDSSSTDGSIAELAAHETHIPIRIHRILKSDFQHGRTRNLCASLANGEFIAFLTQDALPMDQFWLYNLVTVLEGFPNAAGAFGRHAAWPEATVFVKRDITNHFNQFLEFPLALSRDTDVQRYQIHDRKWRQILHYFSDNNSCLKKTVWEMIPYPEVDYGEDQLWADEIIKRGFQKVYVPNACVYHSHDYMPNELAERAETESFFFARSFAYDSYDFNRSFEDQLASIQNTDAQWARENGVSEDELARRLTEDRIQLFGRAKGMARAKAVEQNLQHPVRR